MPLIPRRNRDNDDDDDGQTREMDAGAQSGEPQRELSRRCPADDEFVQNNYEPVGQGMPAVGEEGSRDGAREELACTNVYVRDRR